MIFVDIILILLLATFAIVGWKQGLIKGAVSLVGLIIVFVIAFTFKSEIGNILCKHLPFFEFSGDIEGLVALNIFVYQLIGFFAIYVVLYGIYKLALKLSGSLQKLVDKTIILALPSKIGGAIVGLLEGYIIIFAILMVIIVPLKEYSFISDSKLINAIVHKTPLLSSYTKDISKTIDDIYSLADELTKETLTVNEANLEMIDRMIKYDVVSKKTVEQLIVLDKLNDVKGLDKVLEKYK